MCEIHFYKCKSCGRRSEEWKKLPSCDSSDPKTKCDDSLCLYAGSVKKPEPKECQACLWNRDNSGTSAENSPRSPGETGEAGEKGAEEKGGRQEKSGGADKSRSGHPKRTAEGTSRKNQGRSK